MSYTNTTTYLGMPQWESTDLPTWDNDLNGAFSTLDSKLKWYPQNRQYISVHSGSSTAESSFTYSFTSAQQTTLEKIYNGTGNIYLLLSNSATSSMNTHHATCILLYNANWNYYDDYGYFNLQKVAFAPIPSIHSYGISMTTSTLQVSVRDKDYSSAVSLPYLYGYLFLEY